MIPLQSKAVAAPVLGPCVVARYTPTLRPEPKSVHASLTNDSASSTRELNSSHWIPAVRTRDERRE
jgi:hypothetical protein